MCISHRGGSADPRGKFPVLRSGRKRQDSCLSSPQLQSDARYLNIELNPNSVSTLASETGRVIDVPCLRREDAERVLRKNGYRLMAYELRCCCSCSSWIFVLRKIRGNFYNGAI